MALTKSMSIVAELATLRMNTFRCAFDSRLMLRTKVQNEGGGDAYSQRSDVTQYVVLAGLVLLLLLVGR